MWLDTNFLTPLVDDPYIVISSKETCFTLPSLLRECV